MKFTEIKVKAYSGYRVNERPSGFRFKGVDHTITRIIDQWYEGGKTSTDPLINYFKVETSSGKQFFIRYNSLFDVWSVMIQE